MRSYARIWASAIAGTSYVPLSRDEVLYLLEELARELIDGLLSEPFSADAARAVGARMVQAHFTDAATIERSVHVLGERLLDEFGLIHNARLRGRISRLQGALAHGYARALRERTLGEQEQIRGAVLAARDEVEVALRESEARFRAMFTEAAIGIGICDMKGRVLDANASLQRMLGATRDHMITTNVRDYIDPDDEDAGLWDSYYRVACGELDHYQVEKRMRCTDGGSVWAHVTASLVRDDASQPLYIVAMMEDISARHDLEERLRYQATHDPLTRLPNRSLFQERLAAVFEQPGCGIERVGVCYLDLDGFKVINDSLGHDIGDQLLVAVATRLTDAVSADDRLIARMGGDEFVVLVEGTSGTDDVIAIAEIVKRALCPPIEIAGHELSVSASIGIVERAVASTAAADLMRDADITQYWAKSEGRGRWAVHDRTRNAYQVARFALAAAMPAALEREEFYVEYQPLVRLDDERTVGVEALVRWQHPELGRLGPDRFVELAEETGLIVRLGRWVLRSACAQARRWYDRFGDSAPFVSVNLAVRQSREPDLVSDVCKILDDTGLPARLLQLELTESAIMSTADEPLEALRTLSDMGVRIAIDDFGTGYSNLAYLRHLPVHELKIAGSFVDGLRQADQGDPVDGQIVAMLVTLAHMLGLTVTAESVETPEQAERLRQIGCDAGQGWLFARPGPAEAIDSLLMRA